MLDVTPTTAAIAVEVRVRGRVQGVGFRPHVYRIARELGVTGEVRNDGEGVLIRASASRATLSIFLERLAREAPPLARVERIETAELRGTLDPDFRIASSQPGRARTQIAPDAVVCAACVGEVLSPGERRFRYPFTSCTECGPRLSIAHSIPFDRATTTLSQFPLCPACAAQYHDGSDRRFHAEGIACPACGPKTRLERVGSAPLPDEGIDHLQAVQRRLEHGAIVAIQGLGGYQLACDATCADAVSRLRERKRREAKPFALMARDLSVVQRYCVVSAEEARLLTSWQGPIVLLERREAGVSRQLAEAVAPGQQLLAFMLPTTPLHVLLCHAWDRPLIMTSGNVADTPPCLDDAHARLALAPIADYLLWHGRDIAHRVDDSVARVMDGRARLLRRARGYAPAPIRLPPGFEAAPALTAFGGELKGTFCVLADGEGWLSSHQGDLDDHDSFTGYQNELAWHTRTFRHEPCLFAADFHPGYASSQLAAATAERAGLPLTRVQHHHAHAAACLVENAWPLESASVLAIVLDGLGLGEDGSLLGGEFLLADYRRALRLATLKPVALIGGDQAAREPWRNLYAHLISALGAREFHASCESLPVYHRLCRKPLHVLDRMLETSLNTPLASSCGRLFDAVAAALDIAFDHQAYEGHAAARLEALAGKQALRSESDSYAHPFAWVKPASGNLRHLDPAPMWRALLGELRAGTAAERIALHFHRGLARALAEAACALAADGGGRRFEAVALSGGCFQNRVLLEETASRLRSAGFAVLTHAEVPPNDGGLALGQAAVAAARAIGGTLQETPKRTSL